MRQPQARVVGIDISDRSLQHSQTLARHCAVENLTLHQLPIERVGQLNQQFDLIVCTGALYHLEDPEAGLCALRGVLRCNGAMVLMLYGQYGRAGVYMYQDYCKLLGVGLENQELADLRHVLQYCPNDHPLAPMLKQTPDFNNSVGLADLLLNPRDKAYTVAEIHTWLQRCGMKMCRWFHQAPYLPGCSVLAHGPHCQRLNDLAEPDQHAAMELFGGSISKHEFIACRDDRRAGDYTISFRGKAWRHYVPVRFPGISIETQDLPKGVLARLRNNQHMDPEITIDFDQERVLLCQAMADDRTISEIAAAARIQGDRQAKESAAKRCFQTLWQFDQVFFKVHSHDDADQRSTPVTSTARC